jgi:CRP-like cAMP-binding protein
VVIGTVLSGLSALKGVEGRPQDVGPSSAFVSQERNQILAAALAKDDAQLGPRLQTVHLEARRVLAVAEEPIEYVYFPLDAVVTLLVPMEDGTAVEGATIGREGVVGLQAFLGDFATAQEFMVQVGGEAVRMSPHGFRSTVAGSSELQSVLHGYTLAFISQLARTAACNQLHSIGQRVARWLLMAHDRVGHDTFAVTHERLAALLGVRRASVSQAAEALQTSGILEYRRGQITVLDARRLEEQACEDYRLTRDAYQALYPRISS